MKFIVFNGWTEFWQKAGELVMTPDEAGMNYLTRILIAIGVIVVAWLLLRLISFVYKRVLHVKKSPKTIDASAKFFILNIIKIFYWLAIAFIVISGMWDS